MTTFSPCPYMAEKERKRLRSLVSLLIRAVIPGEGNGNLLKYSCGENPMDRGAWLATVHGVTESDTT